MPPLFRTAALKPEMSILADDEEPDASGDWQTVVVHGQRIGIRTAVLEEKVRIQSLGVNIVPSPDYLPRPGPSTTSLCTVHRSGMHLSTMFVRYTSFVCLACDTSTTKVLGKPQQCKPTLS